MNVKWRIDDKFNIEHEIDLLLVGMYHEMDKYRKTKEPKYIAKFNEMNNRLDKLSNITYHKSKSS